MFSMRASNNLLIYAAGLAGVMALFPVLKGATAETQGPRGYVRVVRTIETADRGVVQPAGLSFALQADAFLVQPARAGSAPGSSARIVLLSHGGDPAGSLVVPEALADPLNIAVDGRQRLLLLDVAQATLLALPARPDGRPDPAAVTRYAIRPLQLQTLSGMAIDPRSGRLWLLERGAPRLVWIDPDAPSGYDAEAALRDGRVGHVNLARLGLVDLRALALNPRDGHLYLMSGARQVLYELSTDGQLVATRDLQGLRRLRDVQGLVFAPSGDLTDAPATLSLYVTDSGAGVTRGGQIVELALTPPAVDPRAAQVTATLVRIVNTSQWSPPSPDPMGVAYISTSNRLLVSDSEVEETPQIYWHRVNAFEATLPGDLVGTASTMSFSGEPTGLAFNPNNGHLFVSEDDRKLVFEIDPGLDGQFFTPDDSRTSFSTQKFNSRDPEGIAFDSWNGHLFIADGLNAEVYEVAPGANGRFDGVPPAGDDQVSHFDTSRNGLIDPEGIEFNPDTGTLYLVSSQKKVFELTTAGALMSVIDLAFLSPGVLSGVAYGPSSMNPAERALYISDRGVDNNDDPDENDGKVYEISLGRPAVSPTRTATDTPTPTATDTPTATATPVPRNVRINLPLIIS